MYALISDVHLHNWSSFASTNADGENTRLRIILNEIRNVANELKEKIPTERRLYIAGDLFHVRGKIAPSVLNPTLALFRELTQSPYNIEIRIIPGNHDLESKDTHELTNAVQALASLGCTVCNQSMIFGDDKVVMIPWYDKLDDLRAEIHRVVEKLFGDGDDVNEWDLIIHAPLNGVIKGIPDLGLDPEELWEVGFKRVFCGHYHNHKVFHFGTNGRLVVSIGALTHQTWSDVDTEFGGLLVSDTNFITVDNNAPQFVNFTVKDLDDTDSASVAELMSEGNYVRGRFDELTEVQIKELREMFLGWGAAGVIIEARPKTKEAGRTVSIEAGASLVASIKDWIDANADKSLDKAALEKECADVLAAIDEVM